MSRIGEFTDDDVAGWMALSPGIAPALAAFSQAVYNRNRLPMRVREIARIVIAEDNECVVCQNTRDADGPAAGVDEDLYARAADWRTWPGYSEQERLAAESGAASVRSCVLLRKSVTRESAIDADYIGFDIPNEFVVGYGLDYNEQYRNLPYIGVLKEEAIQRLAR